jgi:hypothetical protein
MGEIWKDIEDYEGYYQVSNQGRVKSLARVIVRSDGSLLPIKEKIMKPFISSKGYNRIDLHNNTGQTKYKVARLVAIAFIPNPLNKPEVNHIDTNKLNDNVENLEWNTGSENIIHAYKNNLMHIPHGENRYNAKLTEQEAIRILELFKNKIPRMEIAKMYNVTYWCIRSITDRISWKYLK